MGDLKYNHCKLHPYAVCLGQGEIEAQLLVGGA